MPIWISSISTLLNAQLFLKEKIWFWFWFTKQNVSEKMFTFLGLFHFYLGVTSIDLCFAEKGFCSVTEFLSRSTVFHNLLLLSVYIHVHNFVKHHSNKTTIINHSLTNQLHKYIWCWLYSLNFVLVQNCNCFEASLPLAGAVSQLAWSEANTSS